MAIIGITTIKEWREIMGSLIKGTDGYKTYLVAVIVVLVGLRMLLVENATLEEALLYILNGLGLASLRHGVAKVGNGFPETEKKS